MSKTLDYINSGKDERLSGKYRPTDEEIKTLEGFEKQWEEESSISFGQDEDGYYGTVIDYYKEENITITTHDIFDGEADGRESVLDGFSKGKSSWEDILKEYADEMKDVNILV